MNMKEDDSIKGTDIDEETATELENIRQVPRILEFFTIDGLYRMVGCVKSEFVLFITKELIDNALDKKNVRKILAGIISDGKTLYVYVADDGGKRFNSEAIKKITAFEMAPSSKRGIRGVKRGVLGNALQCCLGISYALWQDYERPQTTVQIVGDGYWEIGFRVVNGRVEPFIKEGNVEECTANLDPQILEDVQISNIDLKRSTLIVFKLPIHKFEGPLSIIYCMRVLNPGTSIYYRENENFYEYKAILPGTYTPSEDLGDIWWYDFNDFKVLVQEFPNVPVGKFIRLFRRFKDIRYSKKVVNRLNLDPTVPLHALSENDLYMLFNCLRNLCKPISPRSLPTLGEEALRLLGATKYFVRRKIFREEGRVVPLSLEIAVFPWFPVKAKIIEAINFTVSIHRPFSQWAWEIENNRLETIESYLSKKGVNSTILIHLVCPNIRWLDPSKGEMAEIKLVKDLLIPILKKISEVSGQPLWDEEKIISAVNDILLSYPDLDFSVRQIFYRLGAVYGYPLEKRAYKWLVKVLTKAREEGLIDADRICDFSRPEYYNNPPYQTLEDYLQVKLKLVVEEFDLDRWADQPYYVEVWIEKEALSRVILSVCIKYRVNLIVKRGYSSYTQVYRAGKRFPDGKPAIILYLGDHDPPGLHIEMKLRKRLTEMLIREGKNVHLEVRRIALTYEQILEYGLPPSPLKKVGQGRKEYKEKFGDRVWELDALDPLTLRNILEEEIKRLIDWEKWERREKEVEESRNRLKKLLEIEYVV